MLLGLYYCYCVDKKGYYLFYCVYKIKQLVQRIFSRQLYPLRLLLEVHNEEFKEFVIYFKKENKLLAVLFYAFKTFIITNQLRGLQRFAGFLSFSVCKKTRIFVLFSL